MTKSNSPEEYYEKLGATEQKIVDNWSQKRSMLLQSMVSKSIEDSLKDHSPTERSSSPYVKLLVKAFCKSKPPHHRQGKQSMSAELTIWRVSEEQLHLMKEGSVVRMKNLGVKSDRGGLLQLSANADTQMEPLQSEPTNYQLIQSGYEERCPKSIIRINIMSKKSEHSRLAREVDVIACIVKIIQINNHTSAAYLTDESGLILKLMRTHAEKNKDPFHLGHADASLPAVVAFCNIQVASFNTIEQCAEAVWTLSSCNARKSMQMRFEELQSWCEDPFGRDHCSATLDRINAGLPACAATLNRYKVCIGYLLGFWDLCFESTFVAVAIDYGKEHPLTARFPVHLLGDAVQLTRYDGAPNNTLRCFLGSASLHATLPLLSEYFQNNQTLIRFSLEAAPSYGQEHSLPAVTGISIAATESLARLNLT